MSPEDVGSRPSASSSQLHLRSVDAGCSHTDPLCVFEAGSKGLNDADDMSSLFQLEWDLQQRAQALQRDMESLAMAKQALQYREAEERLRQEAAAERERLEVYLHTHLESVVASLDENLAGSRAMQQEVVARAEACTEELKTLKAKVSGWLQDLEAAARQCEAEVRSGLDVALEDMHQRSRRKVAEDLQLLMRDVT
mmetsp:Transcript_46558/g.110726  ORF Transcript_46558/g.110726 Transcript_46558/m.110726 type:complete len:196 (+) Transcript_46558:114-701(+)